MKTPGPIAGTRSSLTWPLLICIIIQSMVTASALSVAVMAPVLAPFLGINPVASGSYISIIYLTAALSSSRAAFFLRRFDAYHVTVLSLILVSAGTSFILIGTLWSVILAAIIAGIGYGLTSPATSALLAELTEPNNRALVFSIKQTGVPAGGMIAGLSVPLLLKMPLSTLTDWQTAISAIMLINTVVIVASLIFKPDLSARPTAQTKHCPDIKLKTLLARRSVRVMVGASFIFAGFQIAVSAYFVLHLVDQVGLTLLQAGGIYALCQAAGIAGRFIWGMIADHLHANHSILIALALGMVLTGFAAALLSEDSSWLWIWIVGAALGATTNAWTGIYMAELIRHVPIDQVGTVTGTAMSVTFSGVFAGPLLFGLLSSLFSTYAAGYALFVVGCMFAAWLLWQSGSDALSNDRTTPVDPI